MGIPLGRPQQLQASEAIVCVTREMGLAREAAMGASKRRRRPQSSAIRNARGRSKSCRIRVAESFAQSWYCDEKSQDFSMSSTISSQALSLRAFDVIAA